MVRGETCYASVVAFFRIPRDGEDSRSALVPRVTDGMSMAAPAKVCVSVMRWNPPKPIHGGNEKPALRLFTPNFQASLVISVGHTGKIFGYV